MEVHLDPPAWAEEGWFAGNVVRIDPYSAHRSFYWVELDIPVRASDGSRVGLVSVFNPKHLRRAGKTSAENG